MPLELDDSQSHFGARDVPLPLDVVMSRLRAAIGGWDVERDAIRSVTSQRAIVELDVSRYTTLTVRFVAAANPDEEYRSVSTTVHVEFQIRSTNWGLTVTILLVNLLVGIPVAVVLRRRERERALEIARSLVSHVFVALTA